MYAIILLEIRTLVVFSISYTNKNLTGEYYEQFNLSENDI